MDETPNLQLPLLMPAQAQKHIIHNEALIRLDAVVQLSVIDRDLTAPPGSPEDGDRYIVAAGATGAWDGWDLALAVRSAGAWLKVEPREGWLCWVEDEDTLLGWDGGDWIIPEGSDELQDVALFGLATTADGSNPFSAELNDALWTAKYAADGGSGDLSIAHNKETAADTLALKLRTGHSGRAEIGLIGSDDLSLRVSPDGSTWQDAIIADKDDGLVRFPQGILHAPTLQPLSSLILLPSIGDNITTAWRSDTSRSDNPRTSTVSSVSGDTITITTSEALKFGRFTSHMAGCAYVRVWNASKSPEQSAWVIATPSTTTLKVLDASAIATWTNGESLRLGDPTTIAPTPSFSVDISPLLLATLGTVFRQSGLLLRISTTGTSAIVSVSDTAASASALVPVKSFTDGTMLTQEIIVRCSVLSPISNSNLLFIREQGTVTGATITVVGVYG